jgi:predicted nuclease with TOPRIM domain
MIGALASERDTIQSRLEAAQARIAELEGQNRRLIEDRARFPDRPDWVGEMIGAHFKNMENRIQSAEGYTRQYEARLRMEQRKTKELTEALESIVTWGNSDHCTKLRSIARAALEGKG